MALLAHYTIVLVTNKNYYLFNLILGKINSIFCVSLLKHYTILILTIKNFQIKALEQQQSQLLAVRSIPDKPPPPYTPPMDARSSRPRRRFTPDEAVNTLHKLLQGEEEADDSNPLEVYVKDFCEEAAERRKVSS